MSQGYREGDVALSRMLGPIEHYLIGHLVTAVNPTGWTFKYVDNDTNLDRARVKASAAAATTGGTIHEFLNPSL